MEIAELLWPEDRVEHIARHGVERAEVEEVCLGRPLVLRAKSRGFQQSAETVPVLLTRTERAAVSRIAASRGIEEAALIHEWVREKLPRS